MFIHSYFISLSIIPIKGSIEESHHPMVTCHLAEHPTHIVIHIKYTVFYTLRVL